MVPSRLVDSEDPSLRRRKGPGRSNSAADSFYSEVVASIHIPHDGERLSYLSYLALAEDLRSNDEAAVVDQHFTRKLLQWLGYDESDWIYNRPPRDTATQAVPDYRVIPRGLPAFIVEDKNTTERFTRRHVEQLRRYVAGTSGYAIWTNGREVIGLRFPAQGEPEILARFQVLPLPDGLAQEASIANLRELFHCQRYTELPKILERICVDEDEWERTDVSSPEAREKFISSTKGILSRLSLAARAGIDHALAETNLARQELARIERALENELDGLIDSLKRGAHRGRELDDLANGLRHLISRPMEITEDRIESLRPATVAQYQNEIAWERYKQVVIELSMEYREADLQWAEARRVTTAAEVWKTRHKVIESEATTEEQRLQAYAEQVAYAFFLRLLSARILEDRGLLPRLISDGGLARWRALLHSQLELLGDTEAIELLPEALLAILYRKVSRCYRHFFSQPVFDWFEPDEYLLARALAVLSEFDFRTIQEDILGFTYEAYIDEVARGKKGHFLTRAELVELILSEAGYEGRQVLGRRLLDPAAGSGSFLVQAARRLRLAIYSSEGIAPDDESAEPAARIRAARAYLTYLQRDLVGMEINPFSCYLAELNLYIQALDDVIYLFQQTGEVTEIDRFRIYNTNSLELPHTVLYDTDPDLEIKKTSLDEAWNVKHDGREFFHYVVGNPPYVNRGIVTDAPSYDAIPFYRQVLSGDSNTSLLFLALAQHYTSIGGVLSYVVPINLLGDASAMAARSVFDSEEWHVESVVRFYRRNVLFSGVLQRVCVFTARRSRTKPEVVHLRGGTTVSEVRRSSFQARYDDVTKASPDELNGRWKRSWLCVPAEIHYRIWHQLRRRVVTDVERLARGRIVFQQGDVNKTRTRVFRRQAASEHSLPITCGSQVVDFGPWKRDAFIDPTIDPKAAGLTGQRLRDALRERAERIERVRELDHEEAVFCLKDNVGMEPVRPIRGALYTRSPDHRFLLDHTLQIGYASTAADNELVRAVFGLLTSVVSSYVLQLFSTNAHVTTNELLRTPVPPLGERELAALAEAAEALQRAGENLHRQLESHSARLWLSEITLDGPAFLRRSGLRTTSIDVMIRRRRLTRPEHHGWKVSRLLRSGELEAVDDGDLQQTLTLLLGQLNRSFDRVQHEELLPAESDVPRFLDLIARGQAVCENAYERFLHARAQLDRLAFTLYGVSSSAWQRAMIEGVPWAVEGREESARLAKILFG